MLQRRQYIPTFTLFLILYPLGWILSHFYYFFDQNIESSSLSIIGTIITFILFLIILPSWGKVRWKTNHVWLNIGLNIKNKSKTFKKFLNGFLWSFFLVFSFLLFIFLCGWIDDFNYINFKSLFDAFVLLVGVGFAEEIIFRGWLMEEMILLFGPKRGIVIESAVFSLCHYRSDIGFIALIPFLSSLFLFGLVLTLRRTIDKGDLWGCIGLHGGLVGTWYLIDSGLVIFSFDIPYYLLGPSKAMVNPIGSVLGIIILLIIVFFQLRLFVRTGRFLASTVNASFKDEIP